MGNMAQHYADLWEHGGMQPVVTRGENITCEQGHYIATALRTVYRGKPFRAQDYTNSRVDMAPGQKAQGCPDCGAPFIRGGISVQVCVNGQWR